MRILLVSGIYPPDVGGPATYIPRLAQFLYNQGIEVEVLTLTDNNKYTRNDPWSVIALSRQTWTPIRFIVTIIKALKLLRKCDAVFVNGLHEELGIALRLITRKSVAKIVGDPVWERAINSERTNLTLEQFNSKRLVMKELLQRALLRWSLNQYDYVTSPSQGLVDLITKWEVQTNILLVPNGISDLGLSDQNSEFDLITVSRLVKWKQVDSVINTANELNLRLCVVGDGPEKRNLENLANELGTNVFFAGNVPEVDAINLIRKSGIYILYSLYEGLSFSLLQAMNLGKPIIVSNARGNTDVITNNFHGLVADCDDRNSLKNQITKLVLNPEFRESLGIQARKTALAKYSLNNNLETILELLKI